ncbi:diguanylate phosphodiesterase [Edwardsiella hoshinae]|uniref:Diguanylate phosphodiesterase n=1 Tax=Edwardsiella hoshinae TaxID=93378 RepID=A0ABN4SZZ2_9GAMM|nr:EAL domain-containing protein [Edwardsiella hoshinae]AOV97610.1 diguanylate phosphodiesterase [Edwardsiella hoshinae]
MKVDQHRSLFALSCSRWGVPLLLTLLVIPLSILYSPRVILPHGQAYLIALLPAAALSLLFLYGTRLLTAIVVAISGTLYLAYGMTPLLAVGGPFCLTLLLCCWGYTLQSGERWRAGLARPKLLLPRLFWLAGMFPLLFILLTQIIVTMGMFSGHPFFTARLPFSLSTLTNYQAMVLGVLAATPLYYHLLRLFRRPHYWRVMRQRCRHEQAADVAPWERPLWGGVVVAMIALLCIRAQAQGNILFTDYTLILLLPVMIFGAMRYGYLLSTLVWSSAVLVLLFNYEGYVEQDDLSRNICFITALMIVFSLTVILMAAINSRQRRLYQQMRRAAMIDPVVRLPNMRCLARDLRRHGGAVLCFVRIANLDTLCRTYGMQVRLAYKQRLASALRAELSAEELVYHLPGYDLLIRLAPASASASLRRIEQTVQRFRLQWNGLALQRQHGVCYCRVPGAFDGLSRLIGELSAMAEQSLDSGRVECLALSQRRLQRGIARKSGMLHQLQQALEQQRLALLARPIVGFRGERYQEIVLALTDEQGKNIPAERFLPIAEEFGLRSTLDRWIITQTLAFIARHRHSLAGIRVAISLSGATLSPPTLPGWLSMTLRQTHIEPWQLILIFDAAELAALTPARATLEALRVMGCHIALDGIDGVHAGEGRSGEAQADILLMAPSLSRRVQPDSQERHIVAALCQVAHRRRQRVVARAVESEEQGQCLRQLGVDALQGGDIGQAVSLAALLPADEGTA